MKHTMSWFAARLLTALILVLILSLSSFLAGIAESAGVVGDCFPDEPVYTPDMPEYHSEQGGSYYVQGQYDLALASFQKAVEIDPSYSNGHYGLAYTYRALGRLDLAIDRYSEVIRLSPGYAQPYASRAELYQFMGRYSEAEADLDTYVRVFGQYPVAYIARGDFFMERRDYARAAEDYAVAIERNPKLQEAYLKYASALLLSGMPEEAAAAFEHAMTIINAK